MESFHFGESSIDPWNDFVCVWKRVDEKTTAIVLEKDDLDTPLRQAIRASGYPC
jgi:hypothetical protein